jgi:serine phosphatase RsbU (regulator of sigma subunit)
LTVPLSSPRGILGAIALEADRTGAFGAEDLAVAALFAQQATIVCERAMMHDRLIKQSRLEREVEIAREILQSLNPTAPPVFPNFQIAGRSMTAESVGGDAFDFITYPDSQLGVSISDAKGKGLPAALLALSHQSMLHALVSVELRLRAAFTRIGELLARSLPTGNFVTSFYGIVDLAERRMVYVNAGHLPPLLVRADHSIELLAVTGPALGFPHVAPVREAYATLGPGDGLVLFTDGVTDVGPSPDLFFDVAGVEATVQALWSSDALSICDGVLTEVVRRAAGPLPDDATVVVAKFD